MFDQTFVEGRHTAKKPLTLAFSLLIQAGIVCILTVIPLLYVQGLPVAVFKNLLIAPVLPKTAAPELASSKAARKLIKRALQMQQFYAPVSIPKRITTMAQVTPAPDIGVAGSTWDANTTNGLLLPGVIGDVPDRPSPPVPAQPKKQLLSGPLRVASILQDANLVHRVMPVYPSLAKSAHIQGTVEFTALINKQGMIEHLHLVRGHPLLVDAAKEAVEQWRYRPTLLNGVPVEVLTDIIVNFTLNQ